MSEYVDVAMGSDEESFTIPDRTRELIYWWGHWPEIRDGAGTTVQFGKWGSGKSAANWCEIYTLLHANDTVKIAFKNPARGLFDIIKEKLPDYFDRFYAIQYLADIENDTLLFYDEGKRDANAKSAFSSEAREQETSFTTIRHHNLSVRMNSQDEGVYRTFRDGVSMTLFRKNNPRAFKNETDPFVRYLCKQRDDQPPLLRSLKKWQGIGVNDHEAFRAWNSRTERFDGPEIEYFKFTLNLKKLCPIYDSTLSASYKGQNISKVFNDINDSRSIVAKAAVEVIQKFGAERCQTFGGLQNLISGFYYLSNPRKYYELNKYFKEIAITANQFATYPEQGYVKQILTENGLTLEGLVEECIVFTPTTEHIQRPAETQLLEYKIETDFASFVYNHLLQEIQCRRTEVERERLGIEAEVIYLLLQGWRQRDIQRQLLKSTNVVNSIVQSYTVNQASIGNLIQENRLGYLLEDYINLQLGYNYTSAHNATGIPDAIIRANDNSEIPISIKFRYSKYSNISFPKHRDLLPEQESAESQALEQYYLVLLNPYWGKEILCYTVNTDSDEYVRCNKKAAYLFNAQELKEMYNY